MRRANWFVLVAKIVLLAHLAHANKITDPKFNVSVQPLRFFTRTLSASVEYKLANDLSLLLPFRAGAYYEPFWNTDPGWKLSAASGADLRIHMTGQAIQGGFYLEPGILIGWGTEVNAYEIQLLRFFVSSGLGGYFINSTVYRHDANFLNTDLRFSIGYDWFFEGTGLSLDINGGIAVTHVYALSVAGGWFYVLPVPIMEFSVGYYF